MAKATSRDLTLQNKSRKENSANDWRGICSAGCYKAKSDKKKCKCKCQGEHHGKERTDQLEENKITQYCRQEETA